ncbi:MAG TPA: FAD-dependent oxidoreductase [Acidimicrobiales bacterium]|nr:FAD-dependent oxidoreductase [Acidimicrobiales bacterium]
MPEAAVIVGASLAGAKAAETLRTGGYDGRVVLLGEEPVRPYERPPLSKGYLRGDQPFEAAAVHPAAFYEEQGIELRLSTPVVAVHPYTNEVETGSGERIAYSHLLLATGAAPRELSVPGAGLDGVRYLRTVSDADGLRAAAGSGVPVAVIGAGWIGTEVAASLRQLGADVTVVDAVDLPLERVLGPEMGRLYRDLHVAHGVNFRLGVGVESISGGASVEQVTLTDGTVIPAGLVVVGVGVRPRSELAEAAGLEVDNGIVTDEFLETSVPGIFAAGDVANAYHPRYRERFRLEHWSSALNQGPAAAWGMIGQRQAYDKIPYFFSDQYDFGMEYRGRATASDELVLRRGGTETEFLAFWVRDDRVVAAMNANIWDQGDAIEKLIGESIPVDRAKLSDPDAELHGLTTTG